MSNLDVKPKHPNRVPFRGVLCRLDEPSARIPGGSEGHRLIMSTQAAADALDSLIGMGVGFASDWSRHDRRVRCGVITGAEILAQELWVYGHLFCFDFPELNAYIGNPNVVLGMSYELSDAKVADMREMVWTLTRVNFSGAAILLRDKAAYDNTSFVICASADDHFTGTLQMESGILQILPEDVD